MSEPSQPRPARVLSDNEIGTALVHLYRGELGRLTAYRIRLDTTTNWAVGSTAGIVTTVLGSRETPHFVMGLALALGVLFLGMETRRYRIYATIRERIRLLEHGYYSEVLGRTTEVPDWQRQLQQSLLSPTPPRTVLQAAGVRMRRNYGGLFAVLVGAWLVKLWRGNRSLVSAAHVGAIPGEVTLALVTMVALVALYVTLQAPRDLD